MAKQQPFMDDGYTEEFHLEAGTEWLAVQGTYRPLPGPDISHFSTRVEAAKKTDDVDDMYDATLDALAMQLKSWDLKDRTGALVGLSKDSLGKLRKKFVEELFALLYSRGKKVDEKN